MSPNTFKVLVVTANARLQGVMPKLIGRQEGLTYLGSARSAGEVLARSTLDMPDIVIADVAPTGISEVMTWRAVREAGPRLVMLTRYMDEARDIRAILAGACGLILVPERRLMDAVLRAALGETLRSVELTGRLRAIVDGEAPSQLDGAERRILGLVADGFADGEIADHLSTTPAHVRERIAHLVEKLG